MSLSSTLKELRQGNNLTQNEFAEIMHCNRQKIADWERGKSTPSIEDLVLLSRHFNVSVDYLLGLQKEPTINKELNFVCESTGLNSKSIEALKLDTSKEIREVIDFLLSDIGYSVFYDLCCSLTSLPFYYRILANYREHITKMYHSKDLSEQMRDELSDTIDEYLANQEFMDLRSFRVNEALQNIKELYCGDDLARYKRAGSEIEFSRFRFDRDLAEKKFWEEVRKNVNN